MSAQRDALERAQARLKALESQGISDEQLALLARGLEREAEVYEQLLEKAERRAVARETPGQAARLMTFGFALLFVTPIVAMIGFSASKSLRHEAELAVSSLVLGLLLILATLLPRARRAVAHLFSAEWRFIHRARRSAASLRTLIG